MGLCLSTSEIDQIIKLLENKGLVELKNKINSIIEKRELKIDSIDGKDVSHLTYIVMGVECSFVPIVKIKECACEKCGKPLS